MAWTPDEVALLRRCYGSKPTAYLVERLPHDEQAIEVKASELALAKDKRRFKGRKMPRWTDEQVARLQLLYPTRSNLEIARELGRSVKSVVSKAQGMGLRKDEQRLQEMGRSNVRLRRDRDKS